MSECKTQSAQVACELSSTCPSDRDTVQREGRRPVLYMQWTLHNSEIVSMILRHES